MQILRHSDLLDVPWKNGGGVTRNIAKGLLEDQVAWTVSRADVSQDGPFSDFSGMMRVLTVVSGGTMTLTSPDLTLEAKMWEPVRFDGASQITSRLKDGPLTDLNLMFRPTLCEGEVTARKGALDETVQCPQDGLLIYHVLAGTPQINAVALGVADTVVAEGPQIALWLGPKDAVVQIRLTFQDRSKAIRLCMAKR